MVSNFSRLYSAEPLGIDARLVEVEIDFSPGLHSFSIVGLADRALQEARDRVSSALKNSNVKPPHREHKKITINLAPADVKKSGSQYDLALALAYLVAGKQIKNFSEKKFLLLGELGLDGSLRPVRGVLSIAELARRLGFECLILPSHNAPEAAAVEEITVFGASNLVEVIDFIEGRVSPKKYFYAQNKKVVEIDFGDIKGQGFVKRALEIAAAGAHNILLVGTPGVGKSYLSKALTGILPDLSQKEAIEVTKIYSAAGFFPEGLMTTRPFRSPHHTSSLVSIIGGGGEPRPGEISLAHRGVLFLDEIPEFPKSTLEALRQPLEGGEVSISRAQGRLTFPARFMLVSAMNPCPCGFYGDDDKECVCGAYEILKYKKKISGPLLDRIDMVVKVPRVSIDELTNRTINKESDGIKKRVVAAREIQLARYKNEPFFTNSEIGTKNIPSFIRLDVGAKAFIDQIKKGYLSPRSYFRIIKTAQTIADLDGEEVVCANHLAEAFQYRVQDV
ncbi:MAG: YifB family Mg chelatase-like AAA ATPase [Anaplasmataceae bacterium]|nr:YifB family Mg chelatase-like AAA ATPase [Anaplasmataceae bacterium]